MSECTLVTGGSGFIGVHLLKALARQGGEVINYDVSFPSLELQKLLHDVKDSVTFIKGNILDLPHFISIVKARNVQRIVHMAALFNAKESKQIPYYTHEVNDVGTLNVLETAKIFDLKRVVFISSISVYPGKQYEPMDEEHPILIPGIAHNQYGATKAVGEILGLAYWYNNGVNFVALRFSGVFGYGMRAPLFIKTMVENSIRKEVTRFKTGGEFYRDYTYVKDCVNAVICALDADDRKLTKRVYLTTSGEFYSASQVARIVAEIIPGAQIEIRPELSDYEKKLAIGRGKLDISLAKNELGYEPKFKLREAIQDYVRMFRKLSS